ncbi:unnamed protein product [Rotaria magnacalcarata]|uniref:NHL repeat containing protein n=1 Tax=Rotaria magnacalcarata TaxID=392030 RepID=A0A816XSF8_9BILA|nr:unnamed protein product [Rotaria magnacalcarata]
MSTMRLVTMETRRSKIFLTNSASSLGAFQQSIKKKQASIVNPSIRWNTTGITVAGVGGSPGNNSSQLNTPADVSVNFSNTLYIADYGNNRIQKWLSGASNGITVAGRASGISGSNATDLQHPAGILVDLTGNIYIADTNNHRIQF